MMYYSYCKILCKNLCTMNFGNLSFHLSFWSKKEENCAKQNLFHYEADWLQMKKCDWLFENIDFSLLSDGMAHLLSSCLSVGVTAEKCFRRTVAEDLLVTKGDWQMGHWDWLWNLHSTKTNYGWANTPTENELVSCSKEESLTCKQSLH